MMHLFKQLNVEYIYLYMQVFNINNKFCLNTWFAC